MKKTGLKEEAVKKKVWKALRDLNYSYAHIQIVLYDEILNNLEDLIDKSIAFASRIIKLHQYLIKTKKRNDHLKTNRS